MIKFNGVYADSLGARVARDARAVHPARDVEIVSIPGRNGDVAVDNGRFLNYTQEYELYIPNVRGRAAARDIAAWLLGGADGYYPLYDDMEPDVWREARFIGPLDIGVSLERYGRATIAFDCRPQRFIRVYDNGYQDGQTITVYPIQQHGLYHSTNGPRYYNEDGHTCSRSGYFSVAGGDIITITYDSQAYYSGSEVLARISIWGGDDPSLGNKMFTYVESLRNVLPTGPDTVSWTVSPPSEYSALFGTFYFRVDNGFERLHVVHKRADGTVVSDCVYGAKGPILKNPGNWPALPLVGLAIHYNIKAYGSVFTDDTSPLQAVGFGCNGADVDMDFRGATESGFVIAKWERDALYVDCDKQHIYAKYDVGGDVIPLTGYAAITRTGSDVYSDSYPTLPPGAFVLNTADHLPEGAVISAVREINLTPRWWSV